MIQKNSFYILVLGLFLIVSGHAIFAKTMFVDGLFYSTIARNLAVHKGGIWHLFFTETLFREFHEHPPLAMWLQSKFFSVLGTSWWVDKVYSMSTYIFIAFGIRKCWKHIGQNTETTWSVYCFWLFVPAVFWAFGNNLLENTLAIFTTFSVGLNLMSIEKKQPTYIFLAGLFLALAFLTKGFVALFPLSFFFFYWLIFQRLTLGKMFLYSLLYLVGFLLPLLLIFVFNNEAWESIKAYFSIQVLNSIKNIVTVDSRFFILKRLLSELLIPLFIMGIIFVSFYQQRKTLKPSSEQKKWAYLFLALGLSGVLPIMVSMKQSGFYILATYPFFAVSFALFTQAHFKKIQRLFAQKKLLSMSAMVIFLSGLMLTLSSWNTYGKDAEKVKDMEQILRTVSHHQTIDIPLIMNTDWALIAYYYRFGFVSLRATEYPSKPYLLINTKDCIGYSIPKNYRLMPLKTTTFKLYQRLK
jgi:4-amino-4-deoxy-L-arabinose transferase-like glycosyltransferase